jgi:hypothetical protein
MSRDIPQSQPKTHGPLQSESPLSPYRAFVVQFQTETEVARGRVGGRVEHVVSGQATHFASVEELLAFIGQVLAAAKLAEVKAEKKRSKISRHKRCC